MKLTAMKLTGMKWRALAGRVAAGLLACAVLPAVGGCRIGFGGDEGTALVRALGRIAATDETTRVIAFTDIAALVKLTGTTPRLTGFGPLLTDGVDELGPYDALLRDKHTGVDPASATYSVSAGRPGAGVGLLVGGQHGDRAKAGLTALGWQSQDGRLVAPDPREFSDADLSGFASVLAQARPAGDDLVYGHRDADLVLAGQPAGRTLATDGRVRALADCLGDVVAAGFTAFDTAGMPALVGVGVRRPKADGDTPRVALCTSWNTAEGATAYAGKRLPDALAGESTTAEVPATSGGTSFPGNSPYRKLFTGTAIDTVGGDQHVVRLLADAPGPANTVLQLLAHDDLPAMSNGT